MIGYYKRDEKCLLGGTDFLSPSIIAICPKRLSSRVDSHY